MRTAVPAGGGRGLGGQRPADRELLLGKLQLAGIASRRAGPELQPVVARRAAGCAHPTPQEVALARYANAVGADSIMQLVEQSSSTLAQRVLDDSRIDLRPPASADVASGRVDPRILALLLYLAEAHGEVGVSCLITGHSRFVAQTKAEKKAKEPRHVSAHISGPRRRHLEPGGHPHLGNQQPGGRHGEGDRRDPLPSPEPSSRRQVISLLDLSGPSFRLPDHYNHIHVGY